VDVGTASKELMDNTHNRSSVEVEQILPSTEHGLDPRDFYASDSPILDEYFNTGQGSGCVNPKVKDDNQVESIIAYRVWFSYLTYTSQANWCETFPATSAPVLHFVFTNHRATIFINRQAFVFTNHWAIIFTNRWAIIFTNHWAFVFTNRWAIIFINCWAIIFLADVTFAAINNSCNSTLTS